MISIRIEDLQLFLIITVYYLIKSKCLKVVQNNRRHLTELLGPLQRGAMCIEVCMSALLCHNHGNVGSDVNALQICVA